MRSMVLLSVMVVVALAAGLSFVLRTGAETGTPLPGPVMLDIVCRAFDASPPVIPAGVPTLVTCTATAVNNGSTPLIDAQLIFEPPPIDLAPPDEYCFFSASHDGVEQAVGCGDLLYSFGDLAPDTQSTITLRIIVRATHAYGAVVVLRASTGEYTGHVVRGDVGDVRRPSPLPMLISLNERRIEPPPAGGSRTAEFDLFVANAGDIAFDDATVELAPAPQGVTLAGAGEWTKAVASGHLMADLGPVAAGAKVNRSLAFSIDRAAGACAIVRPVAVVTLRRGGVTDIGAVMAGPATLGDCGGAADRNRTAGATALPATGAGPERAGVSLKTPLSALGLGALLSLMGATLRRHPRRRPDPASAFRPLASDVKSSTVPSSSFHTHPRRGSLTGRHFARAAHGGEA